MRGNIAGIASSVPKGLPFNFPSIKQQDFFEDQGDSFVISGYFTDPDSICSKNVQRQSTGDRLIIKGSKKQLSIPIDESQTQAESFFTKGGCFPTMVAYIHFINLLKDRYLFIE